MKLQNKVLILLGIFFFSFLTGIFVLRIAENTRLDAYKQELKIEFESYFDKIVKLKGYSLEILAFDYSYWDEFVIFVRNRNLKWAAENLDAGMITYKCDVLWVFDTNLNLVYSKAITGYDKLKTELIPAESLQQLLSKNYFNRFFTGTSLGLMEVRTAPIQPSFDSKRETAPLGYFVVGRVWTTGLVNDLSNLTESKITVLPVNKADDEESAELLPDGVAFTHDLVGWDGKPAAKMRIEKTFVILGEMYRVSAQTLIIVSVLAFLLFISISYYLIKWVNIPLRAISKSIENEDLAELEKVKKNEVEFGQLAAVIEKSFEQKKALLNEIEIRKNAERLRAESEDIFKDLFDNSPVALWEEDVTEIKKYLEAQVLRGVTDLNKFLNDNPKEMERFASIARVTNVNNATLDLFKFQTKNDYFANMHKLFTPEAFDFFRRSTIALFEGKTVFEGETSMYTAKGDKLELYTRLFMPPMPPNKPQKVMVSQIDLSKLKQGEKERERLQTQLMQSSKLASMGTLAGGVAHQLNNPICGILGFAQLLRGALQADPENQKDAIQIEELAVRCKDIISTLLAFARQENIAVRPIDINEVMMKTFMLVEHQLKVSGIEIEKKTADQIPLINGNLVQLQQVFLNIILNAAAAMGKQGKLSCEVGVKDNNVFVKITDTGSGIPADILPKIFDPFFSTKPVGQGTGLGLSLSHGIVTMLGGRIDVESAVGAGTTFMVTFPALKQ